MTETQTNTPTRIRLLVTCLVDHLSPEVAEAAVTVLERLDIEVDVPTGQTCCGQPAFNGGFWAESREMAKYTIKLLEKDTTPIVVPSGSCADMMVHHYPDLFKDEPEWEARARHVAAMTYEFSQFLVDVLGVTDVGARFDGKLSYHPSCHLTRSLGVSRQPRALLANVAGADIVPMPDEEQCCGFGGLFSVKMPAISQDMLAKKLQNVEDSDAAQIVGCDVSCLMHINSGLHRQGRPTTCVHLAQILAGEV